MVLSSVQQVIKNRMEALIARALQTDEAQGNREIAVAMVLAEVQKENSDRVRRWRERVVELESEPDGAAQHEHSIGYLKDCIAKYSYLEISSLTKAESEDG